MAEVLYSCRPGVASAFIVQKPLTVDATSSVPATLVPVETFFGTPIHPVLSGSKQQAP